MQINAINKSYLTAFAEHFSLSSASSVHDLKAAWRRVVKELHPDRHGGDRGKEIALQFMNAFFDTLGSNFEHWPRAQDILRREELKKRPIVEPVEATTAARDEFGFATQIPEGWRPCGLNYSMNDLIAAGHAKQLLFDNEVLFRSNKDFENKLKAYVAKRRDDNDHVNRALEITRYLKITPQRWHGFQAIYGRKAAEERELSRHIDWLNSQLKEHNGFANVRENLSVIRKGVAFVEQGKSHLRGSFERMDGDEFQRALRKLEKAVPGFGKYVERRARRKLLEIERAKKEITTAFSRIKNTLHNSEWMERYATVLRLAGINETSFDESTNQTTLIRLKEKQAEMRTWLDNPSFTIGGLGPLQKILRDQEHRTVMEMENVPQRTQDFLEAVRTAKRATANISFASEEMASKTPPNLFDDLIIARLQEAKAKMVDAYEQAQALQQKFSHAFGSLKDALLYLALRADSLMPDAQHEIRDAAGNSISGSAVLFLKDNILPQAQATLKQVRRSYENYVAGYATIRPDIRPQHREAKATQANFG